MEYELITDLEQRTVSDADAVAQATSVPGAADTYLGVLGLVAPVPAVSEG
ncbi:hypothetical protein [Nocardia panacis]|nr:hypothetical protein [Nocardia panacis]